jgi:hypothetical protein
MPKSPSHASPLADSNMFEGFTSRCTTPRWCTYASASASLAPRSAVSRGERTRSQGLGERLARDEFHDQVGLIAHRADVEKSDESRMFETLQRASLLGQPAGELRITRAHDLDRDTVAGDLVEGFVDVRHSASAEQADYAVTTTKDISDRGHGSSSRYSIVPR